ncbi:hypothetical protein J2Z26_004097 [Bacillus luteolus]|nr:hypothetical protein [Cytobacillus luteolus]
MRTLFEYNWQVRNEWFECGVGNCCISNLPVITKH